MKKRVIACMLLGTLSLTGCVNQFGAGVSTVGHDEVVSIESTEAVKADNEEVHETVNEATGEVTGELAGGASSDEVELMQINITDNLTNSIEMFDTLYNGENITFSPVSLNLALTLAGYGARGETEKQIKDYIGVDNYKNLYSEYMRISNEIYNVSGSDNIEDLDYLPYRTAYEITNSIWADDELNVKDEYISAVENDLSAVANTIDFDNADEAADTINDWCDEKTHGLIPTIVNPMSLANIQAVLLNTIYFESPWASDIWNKVTDGGSFTNIHGDEIEDVQYISAKLNEYYENSTVQAVRVPYINGMEFIALLPKDNKEFELSSLGVPELLSADPVAGSYDVYVTMPYINFESEMNLTENLIQLGMTDMFDSSVADFSGISDDGLFVSDVIQKTKIELDENGTKAAAVTAILMKTTSTIIPDEREEVKIDFNRPFAFMIYDSYNEQIVFMGKVVDISPEMKVQAN